MKDATLRPNDSCVGDLAQGLGGEPGGEDAGDPVAAALVTDPARGAVQPRVIAADVLLPATQYSTVQYSTAMTRDCTVTVQSRVIAADVLLPALKVILTDVLIIPCPACLAPHAASSQNLPTLRPRWLRKYLARQSWPEQSLDSAGTLVIATHLPPCCWVHQAPS